MQGTACDTARGFRVRIRPGIEGAARSGDHVFILGESHGLRSNWFRVSGENIDFHSSFENSLTILACTNNNQIAGRGLIILESERRKHSRVSVELAIYIEIVRPGFRSESENPILRCETVDVSVGGLLLRVPMAIPSGYTLNIAAPLEDWTEELRLVGKAKWSRPVDCGEDYWVGLELQETTREDMVKWHRIVQLLQYRELSKRDSTAVAGATVTHRK